MHQGAIWIMSDNTIQGEADQMVAKKRAKLKLKIALCLFLAAVGATLIVLVDWKLLVGVFLLMWANNISERFNFD